MLFVFTTLTKHYLPEPLDMDHSRYCRFCQKRVPSTAKHCRHCNMCRMNFDHHCKFVNNCVTASNYNEFYYGLLFLISGTLINITQMSIVVYKFQKDESIFLKRLSEHINQNVTSTAMKICFAIVYICNLAVFIPITVLVVYHIYFQSHSITTYDFLMDNISQSKQTLQSFCCHSDFRRIDDAGFS